MTTSTSTTTKTLPDIAFCRFSGTADHLGTWSDFIVDDAPAMICDTHGEPANSEAYETGVGLCNPTEEYVRNHTGFYRTAFDDPATEDQSRCQCGRSVNACIGRDDAAAINADLAQRRTVYGLWRVTATDATGAWWPIEAYGGDQDEAVAAARTRLDREAGVTPDDSWTWTATRA